MLIDEVKPGDYILIKPSSHFLVIAVSLHVGLASEYGRRFVMFNYDGTIEDYILHEKTCNITWQHIPLKEI